MAAQHMDHDQAVLFLEQCWMQTGLGGVHPDWGNDKNPAEEEGAPEQQDPGAPRQPGGEVPRGIQALVDHLMNPAPILGLQPIILMQTPALLPPSL